MKKSVKNIIFVLIFATSAVFLTGGFYVGSKVLKYSSLQVDKSAFTTSNNFKIYNTDNKEIFDDTTISNSYQKLSNLPPHTYQSFISIEDKNFYKHNGINTSRIIKATINNIKSMSFQQGASTITQQLIKNTHLSSKKTIDRKIKEMVLAFKIENQMSKDDILENYLNVIYFGNNTYGISSASQYYFSKDPFDLELHESALLAGMIKSPSTYCPITHEEKSLTRRNLVLSQMLKDKKITEKQYFDAKNKPISLNLNTKNANKLNSYSQATIDEATKVLSISSNQLALSGFKIYTYQQQASQNKLENSLSKTDFIDNDFAGIVINNEKHGVEAYSGSSAYKILGSKRQPGSCIKPLLVYAPAINEDIISPSTQILDEPIKIEEYNPKNVNGTYCGYVSAKEALAKSINIPAVKVLSYVGIEKSKKYCEEMNISFDKQDDSYALALGGMTYGTDLQTLAGAYSTFANAGKFSQPKFISYITNKDDQIIYMHKPAIKQVFREDTAYLVSNMLCEASKNGTAKKLSSLNIEIASKTGTVGKKNSKFNQDAWNISYTPNQTIGVWCGNLNNSPISIAGGNQPTQVVKEYFSNAKNSPFQKPNSVVERDIDTYSLKENHIVSLSNSNFPQKYKQTEIFSIFNLPKQSNLFANTPKFEYAKKRINDKNFLEFKPFVYYHYKIFDDKNNLLYEINEENTNKLLEVKCEKIIVEYGYINSTQKEKKQIDYS